MNNFEEKKVQYVIETFIQLEWPSKFLYVYLCFLPCGIFSHGQWHVIFCFCNFNSLMWWTWRELFMVDMMNHIIILWTTGYMECQKNHFSDYSWELLKLLHNCNDHPSKIPYSIPQFTKCDFYHTTTSHIFIWRGTIWTTNMASFIWFSG